MKHGKVLAIHFTAWPRESSEPRGVLLDRAVYNPDGLVIGRVLWLMMRFKVKLMNGVHRIGKENTHATLRASGVK